MVSIPILVSCTLLIVGSGSECKPEFAKKGDDHYLSLVVYLDKHFNDTGILSALPSYAHKKAWIRDMLNLTAETLNSLQHMDAGRKRVIRTILPIHLQFEFIKDAVNFEMPSDGRNTDTYLRDASIVFKNWLTNQGDLSREKQYILVSALQDVDKNKMNLEVNAWAGTADKGQVCGGVGIVRFDQLRHYDEPRNNPLWSAWNESFAVDVTWVLLSMMGSKNDDCTTGCRETIGCCHNLKKVCNCVMGPGRYIRSVSSGVVSHIHALMDNDVEDQQVDFSCLKSQHTIPQDRSSPLCGNGIKEVGSTGRVEECECEDYFSKKDCWAGCRRGTCDFLDTSVPITTPDDDGCGSDGCAVLADKKAKELDGEQGSMWWVYVIIAVVGIIVLCIICIAIYFCCKGDSSRRREGSQYGSHLGSQYPSRSHPSAPLEPYQHSNHPTSSFGGPSSGTAPRHRYNASAT